MKKCNINKIDSIYSLQNRLYSSTINNGCIQKNLSKILNHQSHNCNINHNRAIKNCPTCNNINHFNRNSYYLSIYQQRNIFSMSKELLSKQSIANITFKLNSLKTYQNVSRFYSTISTEIELKKERELLIQDLSKFPPENIRNFSIIAHIDHGKSTLADQLLKITKTIDIKDQRPQFLDKLQVERERGITVKAQTCAMFHKYNNEWYLLNLIDTPGHVDFSYEVSRSLSACDGALLLVDSGQGVEAQTLANYYLAVEQELEIISIMTKIDQQTAIPDIVASEMEETLGVDKNEILRVSAKSGINCDTVLNMIIEKIPPPRKVNRNAEFRAVIFDSWYDEHHGVISLIKIVDGVAEVGKYITIASTQKSYKIHDIGIMFPERKSTNKLAAGEVGYIACNMRLMKESKIGDTIYYRGKEIVPLPGFSPPQPMVFAGIYPVDGEEFQNLQDAMDKILLTDSSVEVQKETSLALGSGYRCGFLGILHMNVFQERLYQEFEAEIIVSAPTVSYKVKYLDGTIKTVDSPKDFPTGSDYLKVDHILEPMVNLTIICPKEFLGQVLLMCQERRGQQKDVSALGNHRTSVQYNIPLSEIILDFYDKLKSATRGYATMDYEDAGYEESDIVLVNILVNDESVDALSYMVHKSNAYDRSKEIVSKLAQVIKRQLFEVKIQAAVGSKILCSEKLKPYRKDVLAKVYGADISRKRKLLDKQKEGKKKMKTIGSVTIPNSAFADVFRNSGSN